MKSNRLDYVLVGLFVAGAVVGLVAAVLLLIGGAGPTDPYHITVTNVAGLKTGAQVTYNGYPVGEVTRITPRQDQGKTRFRVDFQVTEGWQIPKDSEASPEADSLLAAVAIHIKGGDSQTLLTPGDAIPAQPPTDIMSTTSRLADTLNELITKDIRPLLDTAVHHLDTIGLMAQQAAPDILMGLRQSADALGQRLPPILANVDQGTAHLPALLSEDNAQRLTATLTALEGTAREARTLVGRLDGTRRTLDSTLNQVAGLSRAVTPNAKKSMKDLQYTLGQISRNIDTILYNLDGTTRNFKAFSRELRRNPTGLLRGSQGRRDP